MRYFIKILVFVVIIFFLIPLWAGAFSFSFSFFTPFGGRVTYTQDCTCINNGDKARQKKIVYVSSPRGGTFTKDSSTKVYKYNAVSSGNWVLGLAGMSEGCSIQAGKFCVQIGQGKLMSKVGTSR